MAGNRLDEKRKQVEKQAEKARVANKVAPREVYDGNNMTGAFPFGGYSEDAQLFGRSTRQGGNYTRQHMKEHSQATVANNNKKQSTQKKSEQKRNSQWEEEFRNRAKKQRR